MLLFASLLGGLKSVAQESQAQRVQDLEVKPQPESVGRATKLFASGVAHDQVGIWTSPARIRYKDLAWLLPLGAVTGVAIATDHRLVQHLPDSPSFASRSTQISNAGLGVMMGTGAILFFDGHLAKNEHASEIGRLATEAAVDGLIFNVVVQEITRRQRPFAPSHPGEFFYDGGKAFPSTHAIASWSIATIVAHEYPGTLTKILSYGTAAAVSTTRVLGRDHSPSDILVGSATGFLIGEYVYRRQHNRALEGAEIANDGGTDEPERTVEMVRSPGSVGSAYVALDSPIYDRILRLAGLGYIHSQFLGLRPWTRMACARMLQEAAENNVVQDGGEAAGLYASLTQDFGYELGILKGDDPKPTVSLDRVYTRMLGIDGPPLNDSFHFGQTLYNDFGRPYQEGFNKQTGVEASASAGRFEICFRGEYQHAPAPGLYPPSVQQLIAQTDQVPNAYFPNVDRTNRLELLDTYAGITGKDWQLSIGKQSLWEGVDSSTALIISDNVDPLYMLRLNRTTPLVLPSFLKRLGPVRTEFFLGATEGHHYPRRPWVQGLKVSLKPTPNLELGFSRTVLFAGEAYGGLTWHNFWKAFSSAGDNASTIPGSQNDVGDRRGQFDFHYRLPYLRNWVALYGDFMTDDDPSPLSAPHRSILAPGIEITKFPKLPRLQLKVEGLASDAAATANYHGTFFYWNGAYHDGYTNRGNIMGSWIGRDSRAIWAQAQYWISSTHTASVTARSVQLDPGFIPLGGHTSDVAASDSLRFKRDFQLNATLQYERWNIPALANSSKRNFVTSLELRYAPRGQ